MTSVILVIHLILAIALVCIILLQRSEGGALGMGGGSGGSMGGFMSGRATADLLTRTTAFLAAAFLTPPDPFSQISLALPIIILYEISIFIAKRIQKKQTKDDN